MRVIDLNADMGEYSSAEGAACEHALMAYLSSCSIACGGHAGDEASMRATIDCARAHNVSIGAHPSYPDRENFGRQSLEIETALLRRALMEQLTRFIAIPGGGRPAHVKPHGALYNDASRNDALALLIAGCVRRLAPQAALMGPPASALERAAKAENLAFIPEGFVDRLYLEDGALAPRNAPGAVIASIEARASQALAIARGEPVKTTGGALIVNARSLCIHSDSAGAVETAKAVREALLAAGCRIEPAA